MIRAALIPAGLFLGSLGVFLVTLAPTIHILDSPEFAVGAQSLGFVHAPGYPLYLMVAHGFTRLPVGDVGFRVNLLSALTLALTAPLIYLALLTVIRERATAAAAALMLVWSRDVWRVGTLAEVYAPQILTLALTGWLLAKLAVYQRQPGADASLGQQIYRALLPGAAFGLAVATAPTSALLAGGMIAAYMLLRVPLRWAALAGALAVAIFASSLLYFPLRYHADPAFSVAGTYTPAGDFEPVALDTAQGVWHVLSGRQFEGLFLAEGWLPGPQRLLDFVINWFSGNFLVIGVLLGLGGLGQLVQRDYRRLLWAWLAALLPLLYFLLTYGAADLEFMFGPAYLLWSLPLALGLSWATSDLEPRLKHATLALLVVVFVVVNGPRIYASHDTAVRDRARTILASVPPDAQIIGPWLEIVPMQYVQQVEEQAPGVDLYNLYLFDPAPYFPFFVERERPTYFLEEDTAYLVNQGRYEIVEHTLFLSDLQAEPVTLYEVRPR